MLSKLKIDLDEDNHPIIQVEYQTSDDVRDKMVKRFVEGFGYDSVFARIIFQPQNDGILRFKIRPIPSNEFTDTIRTLEMFTNTTSNTVNTNEEI